MKRFVEGMDRGQSTLFPECLEDWIDENNPVRVIDVFVDELDLGELGFDGVAREATGRPSYHPSILLKLYISTSFSSAEVFYTFAISSLLAFLPKSNPALLAKHLSVLGVTATDLSALEGQMSKNEWLGAAERLVFEAFRSCAQFVSPFSINNPDGWRYWLIHFANNYRARQEYNNVLHQNSSMQAHFGRSGLNMLAFDPAHDEGNLYLFDVSGRKRAKEQLLDDIPRLVTEFGDAVGINQFYSSIYNMTPAHMDDIHAAMIENPDLEIVTEAGGGRRRHHTIRPDDTLRMKKQRTMFPLFLSSSKDQ